MPDMGQQGWGISISQWDRRLAGAIKYSGEQLNVRFVGHVHGVVFTACKFAGW